VVYVVVLTFVRQLKKSSTLAGKVHNSPEKILAMPMPDQYELRSQLQLFEMKLC